MSPYKTVIVFVFFSLLGVLFIPRFAIDLEPDYRSPTLTVSYSLSDSSPEVVEHLATAPLENVLSQISNIDKIYSVSGYDQGSIEITFDKQVNIDFKKFEVTTVIRKLYPRLNQKVSYPVIEQRTREAESKKVLLLYRVNARLALFQIKKTVTELFATDLALIRGLKEVSFTGAEDLQITIEYKPEKLKGHHITPDIISQKIRETFSTLYPGQVTLANGQRLAMKVESNFNNLRQLEELMIPGDSAYLPLNYLAQIYFEETEPRQYFRINGLNSVTVGIYADAGVNRKVLASQVKNLLKKMEGRLPPGYQVQLDYDDTEFLTKEINKNYFRSGLAMGILLLFILVAYRNWRHLTILFTGIVVNLCITFAAAWWMNIAIHLYTIAGLTISFGMMVDNSIIMLDQLSRKNNRAIFKSILGATLTTMAALLLILFLPEEERLNLTEFSIIVAVALACSILVAIFYIPAAYYLLFNSKHYSAAPPRKNSLRLKVRMLHYYFSTIRLLARYRKTVIVCLVLAFGVPVFMLPSKWEEQEWYNKTIGSEFYQEKMRPYTDKLLGGSLRLFVRNVYERSGYRDPEKTRLYVNASLPYGNTLSDMDRVIRNMENYLQTVAGIEKYITRVSSGQQGSIAITFEEKFENGSLPYQLKGRLIAQSLDWGGVEWNIYGVGRGFSNSAGESLPNFKIEMKGYNYDELEKQAQVISTELLKHKRIQKVNTNERLSWYEKASDQFVLSIDQNRLSALGVSVAQATSLLKEQTLTPAPSLLLTLDQKNIPVYLQPDGGKEFSTYHVLENELTANPASFTLKGNATLVKERTNNAIHKEDRQYIRQVGFDYYGSHQFGDKYLNEVLDKVRPQMPAGYTAEKVSWSYSWEKTKRQYGLLILLMLAIYFICAVLFESLRQPFIIVLTIPLSFIGLFLAFSLFDFYFDQGGYAAFVLLGGLVVNSSIFIVTAYNQTEKKTNRAMIKACAEKFKPIMLTILSTCLGLSPFLIGGQTEVFWFALAVGTIGGLIVSVLVTFIILPVIIIKD